MTALRLIAQCAKLAAVALLYSAVQPLLLGLRAGVVWWQEVRWIY